MMKPRNGKVRCEKQMVTFASVISVAESWLPATPHPGLSGADFIAGFKREQVNSLSLGKMETGNPDTRLVLESGGRPGRSSDETFVMRVERRSWLVGVLNRRQLRAISGRLHDKKPGRNPFPDFWIWIQPNSSFATLRPSTRRAV
jgi:hypothetical protein